MPETTLTLIGTNSVLPEGRDDTVNFLINGSLQVDCGWCAAMQMLPLGHTPLDLEYLFFTHCHHDHYLGLPALLFYRRMAGRRGGANLPPLKIIGPPDDLPLVVSRALHFLQTERFPEVEAAVELLPLTPGEMFECDAFRLQTIRSRHPVTGFCTRFTDKATGVVLGFTGDTAPHPGVPELMAGCDLMLHEASRPPEADPESLANHSRAVDAAEAARAAGAKALRLVHLSHALRERSLAAAREVFPRTRLAEAGETLVWNRG